jgi:hypothetical protein
MNDLMTNTKLAQPTATTPGMKGTDKLTALAASRYVDVADLPWKPTPYPYPYPSPDPAPLQPRGNTLAAHSKGAAKRIGVWGFSSASKRGNEAHINSMP